MTFEVLAGVSTSSLIGVAIACMGNVLISLALYVSFVRTRCSADTNLRTVQKLAHRRQNEELAASHSSSSSPSSPSETPHSPNRDDRSRSPTVTAVPIVMVPYSPNGEDSGETLVKLVEASPKDLSAMLTSESDEGEQRTKRSRSASLSTIRIPLIETNHSVKSPSPRSPVHEDIQKEVEEGAYLRSRLWWLGQALITLGEGGNFLSYGFAPASVVAPLGTVVRAPPPTSLAIC
jgi:hypothetical protein